MGVRFYIDPDTDRPHVENHGVTADEVIEALDRLEDSYASRDGAFIAVGRTRAGRYLKIVYKHDEFGDADDLWVITSYPITGKELRAHRRRMKR